MESLEKYFDIAFAAPDGIQKLRELILTLAMQGKLVPQDPDDQPASELLKEIEAEKQRLVKEGKIKPQKPLLEIKAEEVPFKLPKGWKWVRLGNVGAFERGRSKHRPRNDQRLFINGTYPFVQTGDVSRSKFTRNEITSCSDYYNDFGLLQSRLWPKGTLCVTIAANIAETGFLGMEACIPDSVVAFLSIEDSLSKFVKYFIDVAKQDLEHFAPSTAQKNINLAIINDLVFPLPPLPEQHRIVAKIDQLMARCDELEKLRNERNQKRITVHTAALNRLLAAQNTRDFQTSWRFITQQFSELYTVKENVAELRKAILQLAVMGKLVPQDPDDQPVSELLKEIEAEKQRLMKEGKIKPLKPLPEIAPEEVPYKLPKGWKWVRLGETINLISGQHLIPTEYNENGHGIPYYTGPADFGASNPTSTRWTLVERAIAIKGDILLTVKGAGVGKTNVLADSKAAISRQLMALRAITIDSDFLHLFLKTILNDLQRLSIGIAIPGIGREDVTLQCFPLPPLAEQHRIVAKVDQLMTLCDQLEQQIDAATSKQTALLNAVMAELPPTSPTSGGL